MFPGKELRMNSIYGGGNNNSAAEFGPPNFSGGMDINSILPGILAAITGENEKDRQLKRDMMPQAHLPQIAQESIQQQPIKQQQQTFLPPTYNGMGAKDFFGLEEKKREFEGKQSLGQEGLDVKREGLSNTKELGEKKLEVTKENNTNRTNIAQQRADIYKFKAEHPNVQILRTKGGNVMIYDPVDKTTHDTGIDSGTLSDEDEINLKSGKKLEEQDNQNTHRLAEISARISGQKEITDKNIQGRQELQNSKPGFYQGEFFRNPKDTTGDANPNRTLPPAKDTNLPVEAKVPDGRVVVEKDGKQYHLPASQLQDALKQGYKKVGG